MPRSSQQLELPITGIHPPFEPAPIARTKRVFVNRNLKMAGIDWVGFDMDYTLAIYNQAEMDRLSIEATREKLVRRGYPESILGAIDYPIDFPVRGLLVDKRYGNILKMDRYKVVHKGYHGLRELSREEIRSLYQQKKIRPATSRYHWVDTLYALSEVTVYAAIINRMDELGEPVDYDKLFCDIRESIDEAHRDGTILDEVMSNPQRYVDRDPLLAQTLHKLRSAGKKLFLLTNSRWPYTEKMMTYLLGAAMPEYPSFRHFFDVIIVASAKPAFFQERRPLYVREHAAPKPNVAGHGAQPHGAQPHGPKARGASAHGAAQVAAQGAAQLAAQGASSPYGAAPLSSPYGAAPLPSSPKSVGPPAPTGGLPAAGPLTGPGTLPAGTPQVPAELRLATAPLERGCVYEGGNLLDFEKHLNTTGDRILYVGDHIYGDILRSKKESSWRTVMIIQEMEAEVVAHESCREEHAMLGDYEERREQLEDELRYYQQSYKDIVRRLEDAKETKSPAAPLEAERGRIKRSVERIRGQMRVVDTELVRLEREISKRFHPYWGSLLKEANETSSFGDQVEEYACLYTSRVSNLNLYSPLQFFRSPRDLMPHEL
jgi:HAD superfamily 5'-nucleotidase-like hydrolase